MRYLVLTQCPKLEVTGATWNLMRAADLAEKGSWPISGGWMEQTQAVVDGVSICWGEKSRWKAQVTKERNGR